MNTCVTRCRIPRAGRDLVILSSALVSGNPNLSTDSHPIAFCSDELQKDPVVVCFGDVSKYSNRAAEGRHDKVDFAVAVEVAICQPAIWSRPQKVGPRGRTDIVEL